MCGGLQRDAFRFCHLPYVPYAVWGFGEQIDGCRATGRRVFTFRLCVVHLASALYYIVIYFQYYISIAVCTTFHIYYHIQYCVNRKPLFIGASANRLMGAEPRAEAPLLSFSAWCIWVMYCTLLYYIFSSILVQQYLQPAIYITTFLFN